MMPLQPYYSHCLQQASCRLQTTSGIVYVLPPHSVPPQPEDFSSLQALVEAGKLRDFRYIEAQPQPVFLAEAGPLRDP